MLFNNLELSFLPLEKLLHHQEVKYADVTKIIKEESLLNMDSVLVESKKDTLQKATVVEEDADTVANIQELSTLRYKIQYPEDNAPILEPFFSALNNIDKQENIIRILHYGDSQIEGDRITGTLRDKLQKQFGGYGAGTVPVFDPSDIRSSITLKSSENWVKYATFGGLYKKAHTRKFGMQAQFFRMAALKDSLNNEIAGTKSAWIKFYQNKVGYAGTRKFDKVSLYYANATQKVKIRIYEKDILIIKDSLAAGTSFAYKSWPIDSIKGYLKFEFITSGNLDVYGIGFDSKTGIEVDNISMRGSSGLDLNKIEPEYLANQLSVLNTKLIILQYGVNVAPNEIENYDYYEKAYYSELKKLRNNLPGISILVIGISDVSTKKDGDYITAPNIIKIRDAQKNAAYKAGCAFWDLFEAMGGENSMPGWVNAKPALAQKDYTHFTASGAKIVGTMLYNALMSEYLNYKNYAQH